VEPSNYPAARTARDPEALASGNPKRMARRIKNRIVGHYLWRMLRGVFRV